MTSEGARVEIGPHRLPGILSEPPGATGLVLFAHGSGSSRLSARNRAVAGKLAAAGFATLLFDLLTREEGQNRRLVFDIALLAARLVDAIDWARADAVTARLPLGLFGASTGAAAALCAAVERADAVAAVVSRGGRPDLAGPALAAVRAPTLLLVGGADWTVLDLNRQAQRAMACRTSLVVVPGATHLFEEPGALERVIEETIGWFAVHLGGSRP